MFTCKHDTSRSAFSAKTCDSHRFLVHFKIGGEQIYAEQIGAIEIYDFVGRMHLEQNRDALSLVYPLHTFKAQVLSEFSCKPVDYK